VKGINTLEGFNGFFLRGKPNAPIGMFVANNGNIGINNVVPSEKLTVGGNIILTSPTGVPGNIFGVNALRGTTTGLHLQGDANSNSDLFVAPNGRIGINETNPLVQLHVNGSMRVEQEISMSSTHNFIIDAPNLSGNRFRVLTNGNVGIGSLAALGRLGINFIGTNVALNVRSRVDDDFIFNAEGATGVSVLRALNNGSTQANGNFSVINGSKNFLMDYPLDPANKVLRHACIESNEVLNMYSGTITLDVAGKATVQLPDYFEVLNTDFRYQLTCIGGFAQVFIAQEVNNNQFKIAGGLPNQKVSWSVTGVRNDAWFRDHPYKDVEEKTGNDKGLYYYPEGFGQSDKLRIGRLKEAVEKQN
jgi:hypothetical protein